MVTYTLMAAMTSPILAAVLASRQTDIEHSGVGWTLASTAGYSTGVLCRANSSHQHLPPAAGRRAEPARDRHGPVRRHSRAPRSGAVGAVHGAAVPHRCRVPRAAHLARRHRGEPMCPSASACSARSSASSMLFTLDAVARVIPWGILRHDLPDRTTRRQPGVSHAAVRVDRRLPHPRRIVFAVATRRLNRIER